MRSVSQVFIYPIHNPTKASPTRTNPRKFNMNSYTISTTSILAAMLMVQPCPPSPVVIDIAAVEIAGTLGTAVAVGAVSGDVSGTVSKNTKRMIHVTPTQPVRNLMADLIIVGGPQWQQTDGGSVMMYGLPSSCTDQVEAWNKQEDASSYDTMWGSVKPINYPYVMMSNMPGHFSTSL